MAMTRIWCIDGCFPCTIMLFVLITKITGESRQCITSLIITASKKFGLTRHLPKAISMLSLNRDFEISTCNAGKLKSVVTADFLY